MSASTAVLETAELLENILLALPTRDLLLVQRVSKTWKAAIASSTPIQQALFFKPVAVEDDAFDLDEWLYGEEEPVQLFSNPAFDSILSLKPGIAKHFPEASFRRMLACQPAIKRLPVTIIVKNPNGEEIELLSGRYREGWEKSFDGFWQLKNQEVYCKTGVTGQTMIDYLEDEVAFLGPSRAGREVEFGDMAGLPVTWSMWRPDWDHSSLDRMRAKFGK